MPSTYRDHCAACPYVDAKHLSSAERTVRCQPIPLERNGSKVLLIFQSPGVDEWKNGSPVSSCNPRSAGMKLQAAFRSIGSGRSAFDIANVVQCFPGKKTPVGKDAPRDNAPLSAAVSACSKWLQEDILNGKYERIVVFGSPAKRALRRLGYKNDSLFSFVRHPSASGVSICQVAVNVG